MTPQLVALSSVTFNLAADSIKVVIKVQLLPLIVNSPGFNRPLGKNDLDCTNQEWKAYRPTSTHQESPDITARKERGWKVAREAAELLKESFNAERVVVFGSLAQETTEFTRWSGVDLLLV